jgi:hypothetical protein
MNLRDKLNRLTGASSSELPPVVVADWVETIQKELQVTVLHESRSFVLYKESTYPLYDFPAYQQLREQGMQATSMHKLFPELSNISGEPLNLRDILFFDTETTGLAGGTGTYPFLVGTGKIELDHLVVRQYLLPEFVHEWLVLKYLNNALNESRFTVSFNGKSFDLPLLRNRYILNRMESVLDECCHLDVLHAARRIWRRRLPACDLQTLEREVLGVNRIGDIPGELIPHIFFEFMRNRDSEMMREVLEHNYNDIVNMMLLTMKLAAICQHPDEYLQHPEDRLSLAMYLIKNRHYTDALPLLEALNNHSAVSPRGFRETAGFLLSLAYKKNNQPLLAKTTLERLVSQQNVHPEIIESLAKMYEHEDKDFAGALEITERGLQYLSVVKQLDPQSDMLKYLPRLKHRYRRLQRKMGLNSEK